jgi:glutamate decarboxylase
MAESADKNMIDKDEYPQTAAIEERCVHMLADLWNSPEAATTIGCSTTGSSEAAMLGGLALKWNWRKRRRAQPASPSKLQPHHGPRSGLLAQVLPLLRRRDPRSPHGGRPPPAHSRRSRQALRRKHHRRHRHPRRHLHAAVRAGKGHQRCPRQARSRTGLHIPIHVDGASGAFLAPFTHPDLLWDFRLPRVKSINASGHKFGLAPLGVGWALWREKHDLPEELIFDVNYLGGNMPTFALNFSRPGGEIICQYYNFLRLGKEGYREIQTECAALGRYLAEKIAKLGPFKIIYDGEGGIPGLCWELKDPANAPFTLYDYADRLRERGWLVPAYSMPPNREDLVIQRILIRHGFTREMAHALT